MFLVPYVRIQFDSPRQVTELAARLAEVTSPRHRGFRALSPGVQFVGRITPRGFVLVPAPLGISAYFPWLHGQLVPAAAGSRLIATATLHPEVFAALLVLFGGAELAAFWHARGLGWLLLGVGVAYHVFSCAMRFWPAARHVEAELRRLAEAPMETSELFNNALHRRSAASSDMNAPPSERER